MKILIIDKTESVRDILSSELISKGHDVKDTSSTVLAQKIWKDFSPQYVLCGASLNEDVLQFLKKIRHEYGHKIPIIIMSMDPPYKDKNLYIEAGANKFINKYDGFESILNAISEVKAEDKPKY